MQRFQLFRLYYSILAVAISVLLGASATNAETIKLKIDPEHTNVGFKIRHLFSKVSGSFDKYSGDIEFDPKDLKTIKIKHWLEQVMVLYKVGPELVLQKLLKIFIMENHYKHYAAFKM